MTDTRELVELIRAALNFCNAAAGDGLEIDGMSPEDFLMRYSDATGFEDWDRIGDHAADTITALSERCRALEEEVQAERSLSDRLAGALEYIDDYAISYPDLGALSAVAQPAIQDHADARAALTSGGRG